jgi:hypothetical protein
MHFSDYLKSAQLLSEEQFLRIHSAPALLFYSQTETFPDHDECKKTDSWLEHKTVFSETTTKATNQKTIAFLRKSDRNPFKDLITVGRAANNDIIINKATISKAHAFLVKKDLMWQITDQKSSNSTYVDSNKLKPMEPYHLHDNSVIQFGFEVQASFYSPEGLWSYIQIYQPEKYQQLFSKVKHLNKNLSAFGDL